MKIATVFYPLELCRHQDLRRQDKRLEPDIAGQEPHDLELTLQQIASLEEADLVVYLKASSLL